MWAQLSVWCVYTAWIAACSTARVIFYFNVVSWKTAKVICVAAAKAHIRVVAFGCQPFAANPSLCYTVLTLYSLPPPPPPLSPSATAAWPALVLLVALRCCCQASRHTEQEHTQHPAAAAAPLPTQQQQQQQQTVPMKSSSSSSSGSVPTVFGVLLRPPACPWGVTHQMLC